MAEWYRERAREVERCSHFVDVALDLLKLGRERGVEVWVSRVKGVWVLGWRGSVVLASSVFLFPVSSLSASCHLIFMLGCGRILFCG